MERQRLEEGGEYKVETMFNPHVTMNLLAPMLLTNGHMNIIGRQTLGCSECRKQCQVNTTACPTVCS